MERWETWIILLHEGSLDVSKGPDSISFSWATQTNAIMLNTMVSNFHSIICQVVAYGRHSLPRGEFPNEVIWLGNFWYFRKLVAKKRWSLARGGGVLELSSEKWTRARPRPPKPPCAPCCALASLAVFLVCFIGFEKWVVNSLSPRALPSNI